MSGLFDLMATQKDRVNIYLSKLNCNMKLSIILIALSFALLNGIDAGPGSGREEWRDAGKKDSEIDQEAIITRLKEKLAVKIGIIADLRDKLAVSKAKPAADAAMEPMTYAEATAVVGQLEEQYNARDELDAVALITSGLTFDISEFSCRPLGTQGRCVWCCVQRLRESEEACLAGRLLTTKRAYTMDSWMEVSPPILVISN